jgi:hypothetical protein
MYLVVNLYIALFPLGMKKKFSCDFILWLLRRDGWQRNRWGWLLTVPIRKALVS